MAITGTSLATAGSVALATAASTGLHLVSRIETAVADLRSLDACRAQWGDRIDQPIYREAASRAIESLRAIPELVLAGYVETARQKLDGPKAKRAVADLVKTIQPFLQDELGRQERSLRERLLTMNQIVSGGEPVAGLPGLEPVLSRYSSEPEWAQGVERVPPWMGRSFQLGRFEIQDNRGSLARWFGEGLFVIQDNETFRLPHGVRWPVMPGDRVRLGGKPSGERRLPSAPPLEALRRKIAAAKDLKELSTLLRGNSIPEIADQIDRYLQAGGRFDNVPHEGGLSLKIQELVLQRSFAEIHQRYLSGLPEEMALQMLRSLAIAVQNASSRKELIDVANTSIVPGVFSIARGMAKVFSKDPDASYKDTPEMCGFQNGVLRFSSAADRELRDRLARLTGDARDLSERLQETSEALARETSALAAAEKAAGDMGIAVEAMRERWQENFRREREKLKEDFERKRKELEKHGRALESELGEARKKIEDIEKAKNSLEGANSELLRASGIVGGELVELKKEKVRWTAEEERLQKELAETGEKLNRTDGDLRRAVEALGWSRGEVESNNKKITDLESEVFQLGVDLEQQRVEMRNKIEEFNRLKDEKHVLERRVTDLDGAEQRFVNAIKEKKDISDENILLEEERNTAKEDLDRVKAKLAETTAELEQKVKRIGDQKKWIKSLKQIYRKSVEGRNKLQEALTRALGAANTAEELRDQLTESDGRVVSLEERIGQFEKEITELTGARDSANRAVEAIQRQIEDARTEIGEKTVVITRLDEDLARQRLDMEEKVAAIGRLDAEKTNLQNRVLELEVAGEAAEGELVAVRTHVEELLEENKSQDKKLAEANGMVASKTTELEALELARNQLVEDGLKFRSEGGRKFAEAAARQRALEERIGLLEKDIEFYTGQRDSARMDVDDAQQELAEAKGLARSLETDLELVRGEAERLKQVDVELAQAQERKRELEIRLRSDFADADTAVIRVVPSSSEIPAGFQDRFFGGGDPRLGKVDITMNDERRVTGAGGKEIFNARIVAGGESGSLVYKFPDGSLISGKTSVGGRDHQENSILAGWFTLPDGTVVKVLAGCDGAGGHGGGEVVSSAFVQGVHARMVEAAHEGRIPTAAELFQEGVRAVLVQRSHPDRNRDDNPHERAERGTGTGVVVVIVGNTMMIATAGDVMVVHARRTGDGRYETVGYSDVQSMAALGHSNVISAGVHENHKVRLYTARVKQDDRVIPGDDGLWGNLTGPDYKVEGANDKGVRSLAKKPHPTQASFHSLNLAIEATAGAEDAAGLIHDMAQSNIDKPGQWFILNERRIQFPRERDKDNILAMSYEHGTVDDVEVPLPVFHRNPLEAVAFTLPRDLALQKQQAKLNATVGSNPNCDLFIPDDTISPSHAIIGFNAGNNLWHVQDRGTSNGTAINGIPIELNRWIPLQPGVVLQLGWSPFSVYYADDGSLQLVPVDPTSVTLAPVQIDPNRS